MKKYHRELRRALEDLGARRVEFGPGGKHLKVTFELGGETFERVVSQSPRGPGGAWVRLVARTLAQNKGFTTARR